MPTGTDHDAVKAHIRSIIERDLGFDETRRLIETAYPDIAPRDMAAMVAEIGAGFAAQIETEKARHARTDRLIRLGSEEIRRIAETMGEDEDKMEELRALKEGLETYLTAAEAGGAKEAAAFARLMEIYDKLVGEGEA